MIRYGELVVNEPEVISPHSSLWIGVLGSVEVHVDGARTGANGKRVLALLGMLACAPSRRLGKEELGAVIWPEADSQLRRRNLRQLVFLVRQGFGQGADRWLGSDEANLWLQPEVQTDLADFCRLASSNDTSDLLQAHELYRGYLLSELDTPRILEQRSDIHEQWHELSFKLVNIFHRQGDSDKACQIARRLSTLDPLDERSRFALIRLLAVSQSLSMARQEYADLETQLGRDLGISPSLQLSRLLSKVTSARPIDEGPHRVERTLPRVRTVALVGSLLLLLVAVSVARLVSKQPATPQDFKAVLQSHSGTPDLSLVGSVEAMGELAWADAYGPQEGMWMSVIANHADLIMETMEWASKHDPQKALRIGGSLERYFLLINRQNQWAIPLRNVVEGTSSSDSFGLARAQIALAIANPALDDKGNVRRLHDAQRVTATLGEKFLQIQAFRAEGFLNAYLQRPIPARQLYEKALKMAREYREDRQVALCLFCLGIMGPDPTAEPKDDLARRVQNTVESFDRFLELSNVWGVRASTAVLAANLLNLAKQGNARHVVESGLDRLTKAAQQECSYGNPPGQLQALSSALRLAVQLEEKQKACEILKQLILDGVGSSLGPEKRARLRMACFSIDPIFYQANLGSIEPHRAYPKQSAQEIIDSVFK